MDHISLGLIAFFLALLCPFVSPTPLDKAPAEHASLEPRLDPRGVVTLTSNPPVVTLTKWEKGNIASAAQLGAPFYDTQCKVGGCTFSYEASGSTSINIALHLTTIVGLAFLLPQRGAKHSLPFHPARLSRRNPSARLVDVRPSSTPLILLLKEK